LKHGVVGQDQARFNDISWINHGMTAEEVMAKNQNKSEDQCKARILKSRIKEDPSLVRASKKACKDQLIQADINHLEEQLAQGNMNPEIG
jgi:hypothetical protein